MYKIKSLLILINFIFLQNVLFAQNNACDCCSYNSLQYRQDYDKIFDPELIKLNKIREVMVYTKPYDSTNSIETNKYREIKFKFNQNGFVILKTHYNRMGKPHSTYELKRNRYDKIYQKVFNYIDSIEQKETFFGQETIDYKYDTRKRLIKIKERDSKGKVLPDNKTMYTLIRYDNENRIIKTENHRNYHDESSISITNYTFLEDSFSSTYKSIRNGKLSISGEKKYDKNWKETSRRIYNEDLKSMAFELSFEYDKEDRLIKFQSVSGPGSADECPEDNTFIDKYQYNEIGLLTSIHHIFREYTCEMTFEYKN